MNVRDAVCIAQGSLPVVSWGPWCSLESPKLVVLTIKISFVCYLCPRQGYTWYTCDWSMHKMNKERLIGVIRRGFAFRKVLIS